MENPTKQNIFKAACHLFAEKTYHNVSMREIATAANIKVSSIYNHFESKEAILLEIYNFFDETMQMLSPSVDKLLAMVETHHPHDVLRSTTFVYPEELVITMSRAMVVTSSSMQFDARAADIIKKDLIDMPYLHDIPILEKMVRLDLVEPLDVEAFTLLHSSYHYSAAVRFYTNNGIGTEEWLRGLETLFQLVRPKGAAAARVQVYRP